MTPARGVARAIASWLASSQGPDGRICDPLHREHGSYADGFAALVLTLVGETTAAARALEVARRRPADSEFDQLALLLLARETGRPLDTRVYDGRRLVSNNWKAMRAASMTLVGDPCRERAAALWSEVLSWQSPSGLFNDAPRGWAVPLTYHAKFCAMMALSLDREPQLELPLRQGVNALVELVSPAGVMVPYGRSRDSLFGYAAAYFALSVAAQRWHEPHYATTAARLLSRVASFQRGDGHVPCILTDGEERKVDWDVYVNNPDYNAYAAALFYLAPPLPEQLEPSALEEGLFRATPFLVFRQADWYVALAAEGCSAPWGTPFFCDTRYYGMRPLWVERAGQGLLDSEPYRWGSRETLVDPSRSDWIPYLSASGASYACRVYDSVSVRLQGETGFVVEAESAPEAYRPLPRLARAALGAFGSAAPMVRSLALPGVRVSRRLTWNAGRLWTSTGWSGPLPTGARLEDARKDLGFDQASRLGGHPIGQ